MHLKGLSKVHNYITLQTELLIVRSFSLYFKGTKMFLHTMFDELFVFL